MCYNAHYKLQWGLKNTKCLITPLRKIFDLLANQAITNSQIENLTRLPKRAELRS